MKLVKFAAALATSKAKKDLAKLDAHLLTDAGLNPSNGCTKTIRIPLEAGIRLV